MVLSLLRVIVGGESDKSATFHLQPSLLAFRQPVVIFHIEF
jgi:hypothetical protein